MRSASICCSAISGLLSFGHAALFGTGAYLCGIAIVHFALPWYAAIVMGILGGAVMAAGIGALAIRTRGIYFAMVTMALSQCVFYLFYQAVRLDRRRERPARHQRSRHRHLRFEVRLHQSVDALLRRRGVRHPGACSCCRGFWRRRLAPSSRPSARTRRGRVRPAIT